MKVIFFIFIIIYSIKIWAFFIIKKKKKMSFFIKKLAESVMFLTQPQTMRDRVVKIRRKTKNEASKTRPYDMERIELVLQEQKQEVIREKYNIPKVVELRIPKRGEKLINPLVGTVAMCPEFLHCGLRLPMQPYFVKLLPSLGGL